MFLNVKLSFLGCLTYVLRAQINMTHFLKIEPKIKPMNSLGFWFNRLNHFLLCFDR